MLQQIGDQNKLVGILMCFKYFKSISKFIFNPLVNKFTKVTNKKKKLESLIDLNKLDEKLDHLSAKMEDIKKALLNDKKL